ncbi:MAG: sugar ABC transporter permease, partial [Clostridia bacterium]|nr:sugar ABC transporter permease [Clostridia bacterium]
MHTQVKQKRKTSLGRRIHLFWVYLKRHPLLYLMLIPGLFFLFIYKFWPLYGIQMAFRKYNMFAGKNPMDAIAKSPWVGWTNFEKLFRSAQFGMVVKNTLIINGMKILFLFPLPIVTAILLNEIRKAAAKRFMQTVIYVPYFFSWVMIYGIFFSLLGTYGVINNLSVSLGGTRTSFFTSPAWFRWL